MLGITGILPPKKKSHLFAAFLRKIIRFVVL